MTAIALINKRTAEKTGATSLHLTLQQPTVVQISARHDDIASMQRVGNQLLVTFKNGEVLAIDGFFVDAAPGANDVVFDEGAGPLWWLQQNGPLDAPQFSQLDSIDPLLSHDHSGVLANLAWGLLGTALVYNGGGGGDGGGGHPAPAPGTTGQNAPPTVSPSAAPAATPTAVPSSVPPDTLAPAIPAFKSLTTNPATGQLTVNGTAEPGSKVNVTFPDGSKGTTTADPGTGNFSVTSTGDQPGGTVRATATDAAGNTSPPGSQNYVDTVDVTPPPPPTIEHLTTDPVTGRLTVSGTAEKGSSVTITFPDGTKGTVLADPTTGAYSVTSAGDQPSGHVDGTAKDAAGNTSPPTTQLYTDTVDATPPAAPTIDHMTTDPATGHVTVDGTAEKGSHVTITFPDGTTGSTTADPTTGVYVVTSAGDQPTGPVNAKATDPAGNTGPVTTQQYNDIDTTAPTLAISAADPHLANGEATTVTFHFSEAVNGFDASDVTVAGGTLSNFTQTGPDTWTATFTQDGSGTPPSISVPNASFTDAAGNPGTGDTLNGADGFTADIVAPVVTLTPLTTNDATPALHGTVDDPTATVIVNVNGTDYTATNNGDGTWTLADNTLPALPPGATNVTVTAHDTAGNTGTGNGTVDIDTTAPTLAISASDLQLSNGEATTVTFQFSEAVNGFNASDVAVAGGTLSNFTQVDADTWTATFTQDGSGTPPSISVPNASFTDVAGNPGTGDTLDGADGFTADIVAPVVTLAPLTTNDTTPALHGTVDDPTATVIVNVNGTDYTATNNGDGTWTLADNTLPALPQGDTNVTVTAHDPAGNVGTDNGTVSVDTTAPTETINITALTDDTGTVGDWVTNDASPTISGTLNSALGSGETVQIRVDGGGWTTATVNGTDWFYGPGNLSVGAHTIDVRIVDAAGNIGNGDTQAINISNANQAPVVQATDTSLLGLVSAEALSLIDLDAQSVTAYDPDGNLQQVVVNYSTALNLNLSAFQLTASNELAAELGLQFTVNNNPGVLGLVASSSTLTITAIGGGTIDNERINEFLASVHFEGDTTTLGVNLLTTTSITATDSLGLSSTDQIGNLANATILNQNTSPVIEGTAGNDTLNGTAGNDRLYGYAGDDTLNGGDGNDVLRGGAGSDTLHGDAGNDLLIYDSADTLIDGGSGNDMLLLDSGTGLLLNLNGSSNVRNIERIDLGTGDAGRAINITEAGLVQSTTDSSVQLQISGDASDTVTLTGATLVGQVLIDGHAYEQYRLGTHFVLVEDPVAVVV